MTLISAALNRLFTDPWERSLTERSRQEPRLTSLDQSRESEAAEKEQPVAALPAPGTAQAQDSYGVDLRSISPRDFADLTHELYLEGTLSWEEFQLVGFPSELDPRFDETIGALTGEKANPDSPKDMLGQWESRVDFERRYKTNPDQLRIAESALDKLQQLNAHPLDVSV